MTAKSSGTLAWGYNDFLGLGYDAKVTRNFGYSISGGISETGWVLVNEHSSDAIHVFIEVIISTSGYRGFYWRTGGYLTLVESTVVDYQTNRVVATWSGTVLPSAWVALWYNEDDNSGTITQPLDAPLEYYVRENFGHEDVTSAVPTHPPYKRRRARDAITDEQVVSYPKESFPPTGLVDLVALRDDNYRYRLYHQLVNAFDRGGGSGAFTGWVFSPPARGEVTRTMYQESVNGDGYLYLPESGPAWDQSPHPISFEVVNGKLLIKSENGMYLSWPTEPWDGSRYDLAVMSRLAAYSPNISDAIPWEVRSRAVS